MTENNGFKKYYSENIITEGSECISLRYAGCKENQFPFRRGIVDYVFRKDSPVIEFTIDRFAWIAYFQSS